MNEEYGRGAVRSAGLGETADTRVTQASEVVDLAGVVCDMMDEAVEPHADRGQRLELRFV